MSLRVRGKRPGLEEMFGSPAPSSSSKRSRCCQFDPPISSPGSGFDLGDEASVLLRMSPSVDHKFVESGSNFQNTKLGDGIQSHNDPHIYDNAVEMGTLNPDSMVTTNDNSGQENESLQTSEAEFENSLDNKLSSESSLPTDGPAWVDLFVREMMSTSDLNNARSRASLIMQAFEGNVVARFKQLQEQQQCALLRQQIHGLSRDNQILKKVVAIQHERNLEQEDKVKEVQQLKHIICQYREQLRTLEHNNYTLRLHLQRAHDFSSISSQFHPDVF